MSREDDEGPILPPHGKPPLELEHKPLPCNRCGTLTERATLNTYGAQCYRCYDTYCRTPQLRPKFMADKRTDGFKAWARALQTREQHGEVLTPAQVAMYRSALRSTPSENRSEP